MLARFDVFFASFVEQGVDLIQERFPFVLPFLDLDRNRIAIAAFREFYGSAGTHGFTLAETFQLDKLFVEIRNIELKFFELLLRF
jgi:hypothetical protein